MPCTEAFVNVHGIRVHSSSQIGQTHASDLWLCGNFSVTGTTTSSHCLKMQACTRSNLPNVGKSDRIPGLAAGLKATADRVAATIEALGPDHADIAGHSHGGAVALMLAVRHPERVRSLILFALANPYSTSSDLIVRLYSSRPGRLLARWAPYVPRTIQRIALGRMYGNPARINDACLTGYIEDLRQPGAVDHIMEIVRCWFRYGQTEDCAGRSDSDVSF